MSATQVRSFSKAVLGNAYRLEIAAEIASRPEEACFAQELADATGIRYPRVQEELKRLTAIGLLRNADFSEGRAVTYKVVPSVFWRLCGELLREAEREPVLKA